MNRHGTRPLRLHPLSFAAVLVAIAAALAAVLPASAAEQIPEIPAWMKAHIGREDGKIASVVLRRARALYLQKKEAGDVENPCYFAMDATRPSMTRKGRLGRRFYIICEAKRLFRAISSGYGNGRRLPGANFSNGRRCAQHFGNAEGSKLTTGGSYLTAETRTTFKGYYRVRGKKRSLVRSFLQFVGEGITANARERAIGGHPAVTLRGLCRRKDPKSPHANEEGFVRWGRLIDYTAGRSNGCTSWSPKDSKQIFTLVKDAPTTVYIYPEARDILAVAEAAKAGRLPSKADLYWDADCLRTIRAPKFWSSRILDPIIAKFRADHPPGPPRPLPMCRGK